MTRTLSALLLSCLLSAPPSARADEASYAADRGRALAMINANKRLEALPLLEKLAAEKPEDGDVAAALAVALVSRASTLDLSDPEAGVKTRLRARELFLKAKKLGNRDPLVDTLLETVPKDGRVEYSKGPLDRALRAAEAAFGAENFEEAVKFYGQMLDLDPRNYSATLYTADSYHMLKEYGKSADWYERAITLEPDTETGYRYYATILFKQGNAERARTKLIQAVVAEPYNSIPWRAFSLWDETAYAPLNVEPMRLPAAGEAAYAATRKAWKDGRFRKMLPGEKAYRRSLAEETEALSAAADAAKAAAPPDDENLKRFLRHKEEGLFEPYILLIAPDKDLAKDYAKYRKNNRIKLEKYLDAFVVPPASPAK